MTILLIISTAISIVTNLCILAVIGAVGYASYLKIKAGKGGYKR